MTDKPPIQRRHTGASNTGPDTISLFTELGTERILLRPYKVSDAEALFEAVNESRADLLRWIRFPNRHQSVEQSRDWIEIQETNWSKREDFPAGVWSKTTGQFLGDCRLFPQSWESGYFSLSYWLRNSAQGHGYITEAVSLWVKFALDRFAATRLEICCDSFNEASAAVARRLGFTLEGRLRNHRVGEDGTLRTTLIFGLIPEDAAATTAEQSRK